MSSTTVAQHTTQPLNFGPEWLRALSTPETTTTPIPSSSGSGSGNAFKFSATKYRYSKDEILALRANVTERLAEEIKNEILENLKDIETVFRPNIIEPLSLTTPSAEETGKMTSLSSYISGRTPGGGGRGGNNSQQSQPSHDSRGGRGGGLVPNGRGSGPRGRGGGRDHAFSSNRGNNNNNTEDNGDTIGGTPGDDTSGPSSWSRGSYHPRGGGLFGNRVRSYDDREQSQAFRRGSTRHTSEAWRRSRGDEDDNNDQNEEIPASANGSSSWTSRGGQPRRGGGAGPIENRIKSSEKWSHTDERPGPSNSYESNQPRGWRSNVTMPDRDLNSRRPQSKRERLPEWMNDSNDNDNQLSSAAFEQDAMFTESSSIKHMSNDNNHNEQQKVQSKTTEDTSPPVTIQPQKQQDDNKQEKSVQPDTTVVNVPKKSEIPVPSVQHVIPSWEDEFEPNVVATTVVEATLAEDHEYSPPTSTHATPLPMPIEPTQSAAVKMMSQQRVQQQTAPQSPPVMIDDKQWFYKDPQNTVQGPFSSADMERWFAAGYFTILLPVKRLGETKFSTIQQLTKELGRLPFRADASSLPTPVSQPQQPIVSESQKFNPMMYPSSSSSSSTAANTYIDDYLLQQQTRPNIQHAGLFHRQSSIPVAATDRKPVTSPTIINPQLQAYFASQQQQQQQPHSQSSSSLFSSNLVNDPAIVYQQQAQLQRSISATNQAPLFDELQHQFRQISSQSNTSAASFFGTNISLAQSQKPDDIMTRLAQAMQSHGQQQQDKMEEQRRLDQQRRELELERIKLMQQAEQLRLQREEDERRQLEQKQKFEEELRKKTEAAVSKQMIFEQMKEMNKAIEQKKQQQQLQQQQQQQSIKPQPKVEIDPFLAFQQSVQFQKEQQAKIEAQKAENVRRFQQQIRELSQPQVPQQQSTFKLPETANWARHSSQTNDQIQKLNFAEIQKQEQEQEQRAREAAMAAQQVAKSDNSNLSNSSSSSNKSGSWARTLFAGTNNNNNNNKSIDYEQVESSLPESPTTAFNQQATNAVLSLLNIHPKSRSTQSHQSVPWNATNTSSNASSLQDIQRQQQQQSQNEPKPTPPTPLANQPQAQLSSSGHATPAWGGVFQHSNSSPQPSSSSSLFWGENPTTSVPTKPVATSNTKSSTPWTELKSAPTSLSATAMKSNSANAELSKTEREVKCLFTTTRAQDALSKWTQTQFKDNLQAIDVPTLVQLLKDIDNAEEIVEYVQPYIGSVIKAREFASDFIAKRKQLANAEPELDNERFHELAMAPTSSNSNSGNGDEGFQLASSNGQKKKAKKMKGQKIDVKQLGFMVNNRPEQRDDIDKIQM